METVVREGVETLVRERGGDLGEGRGYRPWRGKGVQTLVRERGADLDEGKGYGPCTTYLWKASLVKMGKSASLASEEGADIFSVKSRVGFSGIFDMNRKRQPPSNNKTKQKRKTSFK